MGISTGFMDEELSSGTVQELLELRPWMKKKKFTLLRTIKEVEDYVDQCIDIGMCALDLETTGLNSRIQKDGTTVDKIVGICLANNEEEGIYIAIRHDDDMYNLPPRATMDQIKRLVYNCTTIYHNFKFDGEFLRGEGIIIEDANMYEDTMLMAYVEDASRKSKGLKGLSKMYLDQDMIEIKELVPDKANVAFQAVPPKTAVYYAGSDAICTFGLYNFFKKRIDDLKAKSLWNIYAIEKRCMIVVMEMERNMVKIDRPYFQKLEEEIEKEQERLVKEIYKEAGRPFDILSPKQLGVVLFDDLKIPYPKDADRGADGGYKTDSAVLEKLGDHKIANLVMEFRGLTKTSGTYIANFLKNADEDDLVKFKMNPTVADTGRFSATGGKGLKEDGYSGVNCQNIPANYDPDAIDIRKGLIARPGFQMCAIDYSGEELRIATNMSQEKKWLDEFIYGEGDLHSITARIIFGRHDVTKQERGTGKALNFLTIYGGGAGRFSQVAKIPMEEAQSKLMDFFDELPGLSGWLKKEMRLAKKRGYSLTPFGRRRPLQEFYNSGDKKMEARASRMAVNSAVQGCGADILKIALHKVWKYIRENNLQDDVKIIMPIHDEIVFEMRKDKLDELIPAISEVMKLKDILMGKLKWKVGLEVDAEYGDSFHVDHDYFKELESKKKEEEAPKEKKEDSEPETDGGFQELGIDTDVGTAEESSKNEPTLESSVEEVTKEVKESPYFDYTVSKDDWVAKKQADLIWAVLAASDKYSKGPKKRIRLFDKDGEQLYVTASKLPVDGFLALAYNYDI
jgi:DNA polymerase-1